jgi:hypothetical protein
MRQNERLRLGLRSILVMVGLSILLSQTMTENRAQAQGNKAGPAFTLQQQNGVWWFVTPEGKPFFSLGVCCVNPGDSFLDYDPNNPGYAAWQHYESSAAWADTTLERLRSWGFTTVGGWSDYATLKRAKQPRLPYTLVLHIGAASGAPWWDMWDRKVIATMEEIAKKQILPVRDDPLLLGYYTDNEMGWWNAPLFKMTLAQSPQSGQRQRLILMLRAHYGGDWARLRKDFEPQGADSFDALQRKGMLTLRPGSEGMAQIKQFVRLVATRYYALTRQVVRKYDPRGLILGDRYQSFYYPEVARAAGPYVDAISTNVNANWNDGTLARFYLDTLHTLTGKPITVGEFYMTATENGSGNQNSSSGFPVVATQQERAAHFQTTLETFLHTPYVAGADWFQYYDEPMRGRGDGENYDMGLVDIHDRLYPALTAASAALDRNGLHAQPLALRSDARGGVPRAPQEPLAHWKPREALQDWDRERGFVPPQSTAPIADMYLCWNEDAVYVGLYAMDVVEADFYKDKKVPEIDRTEWTLQLSAQDQPIRIRLGAGRKPVVQSGMLDPSSVSCLDDGVRTVAVVKLPCALFGKAKLQSGDTLRFSSRLQTLARAYTVTWAGTFRLAE